MAAELKRSPVVSDFVLCVGWLYQSLRRHTNILKGAMLDPVAPAGGHHLVPRRPAAVAGQVTEFHDLIATTNYGERCVIVALKALASWYAHRRTVTAAVVIKARRVLNDEGARCLGGRRRGRGWCPSRSRQVARHE